MKIWDDKEWKVEAKFKKSEDLLQNIPTGFYLIDFMRIKDDEKSPEMYNLHREFDNENGF